MNNESILHALEASETRHADRRDFLRAAGGVSAAVAGASLLAACGGNNNNDPSPTPTPTPTASPTPTPTASPATNADVLNFALNIEYLVGQFYSLALDGAALPNELLTGVGQQGPVVGGRRVNFTDPVIRQYALEIGGVYRGHIDRLRDAIGSATIAQPRIDIDVTATSPFSNLARSAGLVGANAAFDVYGSDDNFLLGAFVFADVVVTAYKGLIGALSNKSFIDLAAGLHGTAAYQAGLIRSVLYRRGIATPQLIDRTEQISNARDALDGSFDLDQGVRPVNNASNIVPTDATGLTFTRNPAQVLNIVYLNNASVTAGGFFPAGVNGLLKTSAAN